LIFMQCEVYLRVQQLVFGSHWKGNVAGLY
jgi:hypothetical protein